MFSKLQDERSCEEHWNICEILDGLNQPLHVAGSSAYRNVWNNIGNSGHIEVAMTVRDFNFMDLYAQDMEQKESPMLVENIEEVPGEKFENNDNVPQVLELHPFNLQHQHVESLMEENIEDNLAEVLLDDVPENADDWQQVVVIDEDIMVKQQLP